MLFLTRSNLYIKIWQFLENEMLQLGKSEKYNSKIFLLNRKVSKLSFGNIKFEWKFWATLMNVRFSSSKYKKIFNKKGAEICLKVPKILLFIKNVFKMRKNNDIHHKSIMIWIVHFWPSKCDFWWK